MTENTAARQLITDELDALTMNIENLKKERAALGRRRTKLTDAIGDLEAERRELRKSLFDLGGPITEEADGDA